MGPEKLEDAAVSLGATRAKVISSDLVTTDTSFRDACVQNSCGMYGKCWMCPPDVGDIEDLVKEIRKYPKVLVWQIVGELEDSFDFEGMQECRKGVNVLLRGLRNHFTEQGITDALFLGVGGCGVCPVCAKQEGEPCRFPEEAAASLEAYGIYVSELAKSAGMKYTNGQNTVTYFGAVFYCG